MLWNVTDKFLVLEYRIKSPNYNLLIFEPNNLLYDTIQHAVLTRGSIKFLLLMELLFLCAIIIIFVLLFDYNLRLYHLSLKLPQIQSLFVVCHHLEKEEFCCYSFSWTIPFFICFLNQELYCLHSNTVLWIFLTR